MSIVTFVLELYFAVILVVSGLTKINNPQYFVKTLRRQKLLPSWSIIPSAKVFPWVEISIAFLLLIGITANVGAIFLFILFAGFLSMKVYLFVTKRVEDCGCYGDANPKQIDTASICVSVVLVLLAIVHLWLVMVEPTVNLMWRVTSSILLFMISGFIMGRIIVKHSQSSFQKSLNTEELLIGKIAPSFTAVDQQKSAISLSDFQGQKRLLAFVWPGCSFCPGVLKALNEVLQKQPDFVGLIVGGYDHASNSVYAAEHEVHVPFLTPERELIEKVYQVHHFPIVFAIDEIGVIRGKRIVNKLEHLQELLVEAY